MTVHWPPRGRTREHEPGRRSEHPRSSNEGRYDLAMADATAAGRNSSRGRPATKTGRRAVKLTAVSDQPSADATRRTEILQTANSVIATSGLRTSLQQIADAAGILAGSLYHHFESKEAILVELIRRYHADLDRIGETALERFDEPDPGSVPELITALGCEIAACAVEHRAALQMSFYEGPSTDPELARIDQAPAVQDPGRDVAGASGRSLERLHPVRRRPSHVGRPHLPIDAARRARRHPAQSRRRTTWRR